MCKIKLSTIALNGLLKFKPMKEDEVNDFLSDEAKVADIMNELAQDRSEDYDLDELYLELWQQTYDEFPA